MDEHDYPRLTWLHRLVREVRSVAMLLPIVAAVFVAYLVIGLAMPVLPLHVHQGLGLGTFVVGLVAGSQFAASLIPLLALLVVALFRPVAPPPRARPAFTRVLGAVWVPGLGLAFSSVGFGAITTFVVLLFAQHGWGQAWLALTALSIAFALGRIVFGHLPDKIGGAKVALACVLIEAAGQALIWLAPWSALAFIGAALSGFGYSLVYPGFGVEAVRRAPLQSRGLAMGAYTACLDLALGLASPALGLIASRAGLGAVFLASTLVVLCGASIAVRLLFAPPLSDGAADRSPGGQNEILCFGDSGARSDRFVVGSSEPGESHAEIERCAHADAD